MSDESDYGVLLGATLAALFEAKYGGRYTTAVQGQGTMNYPATQQETP